MTARRHSAPVIQIRTDAYKATKIIGPTIGRIKWRIFICTGRNRESTQACNRHIEKNQHHHSEDASWQAGWQFNKTLLPCGEGSAEHVNESQPKTQCCPTDNLATLRHGHSGCWSPSKPLSGRCNIWPPHKAATTWQRTKNYSAITKLDTVFPGTATAAIHSRSHASVNSNNPRTVQIFIHSLVRSFMH